MQREKETAHDYRYFPEPDLPLLEFSDEYLERIKSEIPELPAEKRERLVKEYNLNTEQTEELIRNRKRGYLFEEYFSGKSEKTSKLGAIHVINDGWADLVDKTIEKGGSVDKKEIDNLLEMEASGAVSSTVIKPVFKKGLESGKKFSEIIKIEGLLQISDKSEIEKIVEQVIVENKKPVLDFKAGKESALQFLVGKIMAQSRGKVNPEIAQKLLKKLLS